jgi:hypothetical protein
VLKAYCAIVAGAGLRKKAAGELLQIIRNSHGFRSFLIWFNTPDYKALIQKDKSFYSAFKRMKAILKNAR